MRVSPVWHPFTQHGLERDFPEIVRAEGPWLETRDGQRIFDGISSWWVITHGHRHPKIVAAIRAQAEQLDQMIFAGLTHEPAEATARMLLDIVPKGLAHVFFSDSGSTSVEVGLKMALGYWRNIGERRTRILALEHAYHGDTVGTMSAGARGVFNAAYEPLLFDVGRVPFPTRDGKQQALDALEAECRTGNIAAFICEPLLLGAGGMLIYDAETLREMQRICAAHRVLFIADEVMTGFGRTGTAFACEQAGFTPDILCLAKGLTGGSIPLAVTLCTPAIFQAHVSDDRSRMFFHSSSYTANPIACAAAVANLKIWREEPVLDGAKRIAAAQERGLAKLAATGRFENVRRIGTIGAAEIGSGENGYLDDISLRLRAALLRRGVLLRPLGNTLYVMPPYSATDDELDRVYTLVVAALDEVSQ